MIKVIPPFKKEKLTNARFVLIPTGLGYEFSIYSDDISLGFSLLRFNLEVGRKCREIARLKRDQNFLNKMESLIYSEEFRNERN